MTAKTALYSVAAGLLFALGLALSGMTNPDRVLGFLTLDSQWDPTLAFVMVGGISVFALFYHTLGKTRLKSLGKPLPNPKAPIDRPLLVGAALFGAGWGLGGFCPGPAFVSLGTQLGEVFLFVGMMVVGTWLGRTLRTKG